MTVRVIFTNDTDPLWFDAEPGFRFNKGDTLVIREIRYDIISVVFYYCPNGFNSNGKPELVQEIYV